MCEHNDCLIENLLSTPTIHSLGNSSDPAHVSTACHTTPLRLPPDPAVEIAIQLTPTDEEEIDIVERFVLRTCGCQSAIEGNACSSQISRETFLTHRSQCAELQKDELDLVILSHIDAHGYGRSECTEPRVHTERFVAHFYLHGQQICRTTFLFLHGISKHRYENLIKHYTYRTSSTAAW